MSVLSKRELFLFGIGLLFGVFVVLLVGFEKLMYVK